MAGTRCMLFATVAMLASVSAQYMFAYAPVMSPQPQQQQQQQTQAPVRTPYGLPPQSSAFAGRQQRSLFGGGGWHGIGGVSSVGVDHITKEELIALVEAWKEVEANESPKKPEPAPEPEPEPEPEEEPEPEPEPEEEPEAAEPAKPAEPPAGPPAGVPLTVSLPAFVPIQLSAMYTAPVPVGAPVAAIGGGGGGGAAIGGGGGAGGGEEAGEGGEGGGEAEEEKSHRFARPLSGSRNSFSGARAKSKPFKASNGARSGYRRPANSIRFPIHNPRTFASANYIATKPRYYRTPGPIAAPSQTHTISALPPPSFLANAPGPLQLVPSTDLMSNWH